MHALGAWALAPGAGRGGARWALYAGTLGFTALPGAGTGRKIHERGGGAVCVCVGVQQHDDQEQAADQEGAMMEGGW